ncbi:hypothetical protein [Cecembia sp.]|uniref:hypothetical protein n=1 Tax=Cecembia sp. TaxID=1898110 RepID=UPI0025BEC5EF|nr:hypothetical protein [Cecembia sp.]
MKKIQKKKTRNSKGILSKLNDNPDPKEKEVMSNKKKGILSKLNGDSDDKE